jgi:hypothetical protein
MRASVRTITVSLLCLVTFVASATGVSAGRVICTDWDGCISVETRHPPHGGCHSEDHHGDDHNDAPEPEQGDPSCQDRMTSGLLSERTTTSLDAARLFALAPPVPTLIADGCSPQCDALSGPAATRFGDVAGVPRAEVVGLRAIVLLD